MITRHHAIDPDRCVEVANRIIDMLTDEGMAPSAEVALATLHVGICMGRDVGMNRDVLVKQLMHAWEHGSQVVETIRDRGELS